MRAAPVVVLLLAPLPALAAQRAAIGPQVVFGDYREVTEDLRFRGAGFGATATVTWKKLSLDVSGAFLDYDPVDDASGGLSSFKARQVDVRLRYYIAGPASAELGFVNRTADPEFEAQSVGAVTAGGRLAYLLGPGVGMRVHAGLIIAPRFSGGGTASPLGAMQLGLGLTVDGLRGRARVTADYEFQRIGRRTDDGSGDVDVPIQQSLARLGAAVLF